jgi:hypothetical protein
MPHRPKFIDDYRSWVMLTGWSRLIFAITFQQFSV